MTSKERISVQRGDFMESFYISTEAPGAWPNGTRVCKIGSLPGDYHVDGHQGTIMGSSGPAPPPNMGNAGIYAYFVHWDGDPEGLIIGIVSNRIKKVDAGE